MNNEAYAAAPISDTTIAAKMARFHITLHSSRRYSPKSHKAVKNTMSNATRNPMPFHNTYGDRSSSAAVTSVLAIKIGVSIGNSSNGKSNSRIRACAEIDESAVPAIETPSLPRKNTSTSQGNTLMTDTLYITANTGSSNNSITIKNNVFAASFARKIANGSDTDNRNALSVSFVCSRKKHGCSINDAANKNASHNNPDPNRRASSESGSNVKLNNTSTMTTKMTVVVKSSRDRNSVRNSLPSSTPVFESRLILPPRPAPNSWRPRHSYRRRSRRRRAEPRALPTPKSPTRRASSSAACSPRRASRAAFVRATQSPANRVPSPAHPAAAPPARSAAPSQSQHAAASRAKMFAPAICAARSMQLPPAAPRLA